MSVPPEKDAGRFGLSGRISAASVHVDLLRDRVRTEAYRRAIQRQAPGNVVLDIGTGSGVLACFAAIAGAEKVIAVEEAAILETAREVARVNGLEDKITFIGQNSRDVVLPERVDILVSEVIGNDPLAEDALNTHADGARRLLRPGGASIPMHLTLLSVGVDSELIRRQLDRSVADLADARRVGDAYGLDLAPLADAYEREFWLSYRSESLFLDLGGHPPDGGGMAHSVVTDEAVVDRFDLTTTTMPPRSWSRRVPLNAHKSGRVNAIATYWVAVLDDGIEVSNSPDSERLSSWGGQMITPVPERSTKPGTTLLAHAGFDLTRLPTLTWRWAEA